MLVSARALTVLVIAHNDSQKLLATIDRIYTALAVTVEDFSIVLFDDGSTDDTLAVAKAVWSGKISDCQSRRSGFLIVPPASLFSMPISAGGWGLRERVLIFALASVGIPAEERRLFHR